MRGVWEKIKGFDFFYVVFGKQGINIAGLSGGIARKINDFSWGNFEEAVDEGFVAAGTRGIKDDGLV